MFEKFGPSVRRTLLFARAEAARLGCSSISPEAMLLGILNERDPALLSCLDHFGQTTAMFREGVERIWDEKNLDIVDTAADAEMPLSEEAKRILALAAHFAESERHSVVKPGHMLWAITAVVPELLERIFGQVPRWVEEKLDNTYFGLPDRLAVPFESESNSAQVIVDELHELVQKFERAFRKKKFGNVLSLNERIENLRSELASGTHVRLPVGNSIIQISGAVNERLLRHFERYPGDLKTVNHRLFEELVATVWAEFGYEVQLTKRTRDGGKDIVAIGNRLIDEKYLIECKRPEPGKTLGIRPVRELYGVKVSEGATKAVLVTTVNFSRDASLFLEHHRWEIEGKDFDGLMAWIRHYIALKDRPSGAGLREEPKGA